MATYVRMQLRHCLCVRVLVSLFDRLTALVVCLFLVLLFCSFWLRDWASEISCYLKSVVSNLSLNRYVRWLCGGHFTSLHYFVSSDGAGAFGAGAGACDGGGAFGAGGAGFGAGFGR